MVKAGGERPERDYTPDAVLALHDAGYREVDLRISDGFVLDIGCGLGFETVKLARKNRFIIGMDYHQNSVKSLKDHNIYSVEGVVADCLKSPFKQASFDWVISSHIIEHFYNPAFHVKELARVLKRGGTGFVITPNKFMDFENPFHLYLFDDFTLKNLLKDFFTSVEIMGLDCKDEVKSEIATRRQKAQRIYNIDVFQIRKKIPRKYWIYIYSTLLPLAQRIFYKNASGGKTGITENDFYLTDVITTDTMVLFAQVKGPKY